MPWGSVLKPPVGISILKRSVELAGFVSEIHLLNMNFAEQIGLDLYECISDKGFLWAEWFFSQALFGPQGSGELQNGWSRIEADPDAADLVKAVREVSPDPGEFCSRIMEQIRCFLNTASRRFIGQNTQLWVSPRRLPSHSHPCCWRSTSRIDGRK